MLTVFPYLGYKITPDKRFRKVINLGWVHVLIVETSVSLQVLAPRDFSRRVQEVSAFGPTYSTDVRPGR